MAERQPYQQLAEGAGSRQLVGSRTRKTIVPRDLMQPRRPLAMRSSPQRGGLGGSVVLLDDAGR